MLTAEWIKCPTRIAKIEPKSQTLLIQLVMKGTITIVGLRVDDVIFVDPEGIEYLAIVSTAKELAGVL